MLVLVWVRSLRIYDHFLNKPLYLSQIFYQVPLFRLFYHVIIVLLFQMQIRVVMLIALIMLCLIAVFGSYQQVDSFAVCVQRPKENKETSNDEEGDCQNMTSITPDGLLRKTNCYRKRHGKPVLQWDTRLEQLSKDSPNACKMAHDSNAAENLAFGHSRGNKAEGVDRWYNEIRCWDPLLDRGKPGCAYYDNDGCRTGTCYGHVQNLLNKGHRRLGCAFHESCDELRCKYS